MFEKRLISAQMVVSNAHEKIGFLHISFYIIVQIVLPIILGVIYLLDIINSSNDLLSQNVSWSRNWARSMDFLELVSDFLE